jgi:hypothetical protein
LRTLRLDPVLARHRRMAAKIVKHTRTGP